ncbi:UvrD-helicase domain-containing protein [Kiritimatiellota bacterium B12222]|nr:UvrD-helicase domain-containing protein [Kiritimatiellota bacterium B12222]
MSAFVPYLSISASAGSGKTFRLSHRVLRLLAMGASPDEIGAYTFSRKAAGEIFDSIVQALRKAASSDEDAARTAAFMELPHEREAFLRDLRRLFAHLHRLRIGTLDSRISQMLGAVSVELGLPPEFSLMDAQSAEYQRVQSQVLNGLFRSGRLKPEESQTFLQLFSEATHGKSEKNFLRLIEQFLDDHRSHFLVFPEMAAWKGPVLSSPPQALTKTDAQFHLQAFVKGLEAMDLKPKEVQVLTELAGACAAFQLSSVWSQDLPDNALSKRFLAGEGPEVKNGRGTLDLGGRLWEHLDPLLEHVRAVALHQVQSRTMALYGFLWVYQQSYRGEMLPGGQLSFEDACMLMADFDLLEPVEMAYRLDGEIAHWLLDEFQDTSRLQWKVLEPFLSEVLQDPTEQRSFFYVGDVKQAIYGWRGGDSELFGKISEEWPQIVKESMSLSFRSASPVLQLVNQVFDGVPEVEALSDEAIARWNEEFELHEAANQKLPGFAEVVQAVDPEVDANEILLEMVRELPAGTETAILVRSNKEGQAIAETLRGGGFRVSQEGAAALRDDTAVEAVLAALKSAAHPLDEFSRGMLKLSGLGIQPFTVLQRCQCEGLAPVVRDLMGQLPLEEDAAFSKSRLKRLLDLCIEFDRMGDPSIDRFLSMVDKTRLKENEARGVIRVMTIHQSKGLGFDAVIVPMGSHSGFVKREGDALVSTAADDPHPCLTLLPPQVVCEQIPELKEMQDRFTAEKTYETMCTLYVAFTRAKQSLQILLPVPPKKPGSLGTLSNWLLTRLPANDGMESAFEGSRCLLRYGSRDWAKAESAKTEETHEVVPFVLSSGKKTLSRLEPSQESAHPEKVDQAFRFFEKDGRELGSRVHALLEQVDWADAVEEASFFERHGEDVHSEAAAHVRQALQWEELRKPEGVTGLWREQRFESVLPEGWITGIFDRVVLFADSAWIQDFKTNLKVDEETVKGYTPQMHLYRRVLADMMGFELERIRCQLLFTRRGEVFEV